MVSNLSKGDERGNNAKPVCSMSLCGNDAEWQVDFFGKVEYYCMRHKPGLPDTLMTRIKHA